MGKAQFALEGVVHTYEEDGTAHEEWTKVKHVPKSRIVAYLEGSWKERIKYRLATRSSTTPSPVPSASTSKSDLTTTIIDEWTTLLDITNLHTVPKSVRPIEKQSMTESRRLWEDVTTRLLNKEFGEATKHKQAIEQKQRDDAAERKKKGVESVSSSHSVRQILNNKLLSQVHTQIFRERH